MKLKPVTRKRLEWIAALLTMTGDVHYERWPGQGPWSKRTNSGRPITGPRRRRG